VVSTTPLYLHHPPASRDLRPEQPDRIDTRLDRIVHAARGRLSRIVLRNQRFDPEVAAIDRAGRRLKSFTDRALREERQQVRMRLLADGLIAPHRISSFALIREYASRILGMFHYESQLRGALIMLRGMVAEMETGEGKTLTATLAAGTAALAGIPVHVISVNDYLTSRDAENMRPLYAALGLGVGCVVHGQTPEQRRQAYGRDITYATNKELVFDYLRDRLTLADRLDPLRVQAECLHGRQSRTRRILMRGLHFAIVDEADSVLIDEARTPLIISGPGEIKEEKAFLEQALDLARSFTVGAEYLCDAARRQIQLTMEGRVRIEAAAREMGPLWNGLVRREGAVHQALTALHLFRRDEQYLLREGKIQIIDEFTGRVMPDRSWEQGLHQLIELKEGCELTQRREPLAKISYQRFFRRYLRLAGMTGTAREVAGELWSVYHLPTLRVPTHRPVIRERLSERIFSTRHEKWAAIVARITELHGQNRPILIGTRTVAASEELAAQVRAAGLDFQMLSAKQDAEEARVISQAGRPGSITIATNMAGRGTDILLASGVRELGGLHVIISEYHEAARIDRQLAGRCGRQGDPGSYEGLLCLEDFLFEGKWGDPVTRLIRFMVSLSGTPQLPTRWLLRRMQHKVEKYHARIRRDLFRKDQAQGSLMSFAGRFE
jgi:preprotein translocase subunit SecA